MRFVAGLVLASVVAANPCNPPPPPPPDVAESFYLAPTGSDANPGAEDLPWRTLAHALPRLGPGDTLFLRDGIYYEQVRGASIRAGTATERITVRAYPGERPLLRGVLWLGSAHYWTLDGINAQWDETGISGPLSGGDPIIGMTNGTGWEILNAEIWGARSYSALSVYGTGTVASEPGAWRVAGNCIHDTHSTHPTDGPQDHNVYVNTGITAGSGVIENNLIFNAENGSNLKLGWVDWQPSGTVNVTVRHNTLAHGTANALLVGNTTPGFGAKNIVLEHNLIVETTAAGNRPVRGVSLNNTTNVARDNAWFDADEDQMILDYPQLSPSLGVVDGGGNFEADPMFDDTTTCAGFHAGNPAVSGYGHPF